MELRIDGSAAVAADYSAVQHVAVPSAPPPNQNQQQQPEMKADAGVQNAQSAQKTQKAVEQANAIMSLFNHDLKFQTHEKTGIIQVSIVDKKDGKVIKELPPDSVLDMVAKVKEMLGGLMDIKA